MEPEAAERRTALDSASDDAAATNAVTPAPGPDIHAFLNLAENMQSREGNSNRRASASLECQN